MRNCAKEGTFLELIQAAELCQSSSEFSLFLWECGRFHWHKILPVLPWRMAIPIPDASRSDAYSLLFTVNFQVLRILLHSTWLKSILRFSNAFLMGNTPPSFSSALHLKNSGILRMLQAVPISEAGETTNRSVHIAGKIRKKSECYVFSTSREWKIECKVQPTNLGQRLLEEAPLLPW